MKPNIIKLLFLLMSTTIFVSCLKENPLYTDFASTKPLADIPKAPANALAATAPSNSWKVIDTLASGGVDYPTAVHISAKDHVGDVTIKMKIDKDAANAWLTKNPSGNYKLLPDSLYTVPSLDVKIVNAGVFSTGDFVVHIKSDAKDADGNSLFRVNKYILPIAIESVEGGNYIVASNFQYILTYMRVK